MICNMHRTINWILKNFSSKTTLLTLNMFLETFNFVRTSPICYQFYHIFRKFQNYFFFTFYSSYLMSTPWQWKFNNETLFIFNVSHDGAASRYKNWKNLFNLLHHKDDFNIHADQNFFTSHGKSPFDGIGETCCVTWYKE